MEKIITKTADVAAERRLFDNWFDPVEDEVRARVRVSTAEQNCARRRRQSVPVLLRERGPKAPVSCRAARVEARGA